MPDAIERPCANGCGRTVRQARTPLMGDRQWEWIANLSLVCGSCQEKDDRERAAAEDAEKRRERLARRLRGSGLPVPLQGVSWDSVEDDPDRSDAREAAMRWGRGELNGLTLCGDVGVGKTYIAAAAMWERLHREHARWCSVPALIAKSLGDWDSDDKRDAASTLTGTMPIVLDDIDKVKATQWVASQLFIAIDGRHQNNGAWIVTTNIDPETFQQRFGPALADRLFGGAHEVHMLHGQSRRQ